MFFNEYEITAVDGIRENQAFYKVIQLDPDHPLAVKDKDLRLRQVKFEQFSDLSKFLYGLIQF